VKSAGLLLLALVFATGCTRPNPFYVAEGADLGGLGESAGGEGFASGDESGAGEGAGPGGEAGGGEGGALGEGGPGGPGGGEGGGEGVGGEPIDHIELFGPDEVIEDSTFALTLSAFAADGTPSSALSGRLLITSDRGDVRPSSVTVPSLPGGKLTIKVRLNREGAANLRVLIDEAQLRTAPWTVHVGALRFKDPADQPILARGARDEWDDRHVQQPSVIRVPDDQGGPFAGKYLMYYRGRNAGLTQSGVGVALSDDGLTWRRAEINPVLPYEELGPRRFIDYSEPDVHLDNGGFRMWLTGTTQNESHIVHAVSDDGLQWDRPDEDPVLRASSQRDWDELWVFAPSMVSVGRGWACWYGGFTTDGDFGIGHATSGDGIRWTKHEPNPVLPPGARPQEWDAITVDKPTVILDGTVYRMWYTGDQVFTDSTADPWKIGYATSTDGIHWEKSPDNPVLIPSRIDGRYDKVRVANPAAVQVPHPDDPDRLVVRLYFDGFDGRRWSIGLARPAGD
jgi:hypothetical protein